MADLLVVEQQVDELGDLQVVDGDLGFVVRRDDQVLLLRPVQLQVPRRDSINREPFRLTDVKFVPTS
jgi:hypothetical protein